MQGSPSFVPVPGGKKEGPTPRSPQAEPPCWISKPFQKYVAKGSLSAMIANVTEKTWACKTTRTQCNFYSTGGGGG